jgi:hypothetical protein
VAPNQVPLSKSGPRAMLARTTATALATLGPRTPLVETRFRAAGAEPGSGRVPVLGGVAVAVIAPLLR